MERKTFGILALALLGVFAISMVVAMPFVNSENRDAMKAAIESRDYDTWKELHMAQLSEENFAKMTKMHALRTELLEAREAGEDTAELMDELELLMPEGKGGCQGKAKSGSERGSCGVARQNHEGCPFAN